MDPRYPAILAFKPHLTQEETRRAAKLFSLCGADTMQIAAILRAPEAAVYNSLSRVKAQEFRLEVVEK